MTDPLIGWRSNYRPGACSLLPSGITIDPHPAVMSEPFAIGPDDFRRIGETSPVFARPRTQAPRGVWSGG